MEDSKKYSIGSLFSGIGGFELVASWYGIEPVWASEIEPSCVRITNKHFPDMKHYGDITKMKGDEIEPVYVLTGGSPCFPAGTMILSDKGYVPIEDIKVGDAVLTHKNRWRKVTAVGSDNDKNLYTLNATGSLPIEATPNHPFIVCTRSARYHTIDGKKYKKYEFSEPYKKRMDELVVGKDFICSPILEDSENLYNLDAEICWLLGRYVADGCVTKFGEVILSVGSSKINQFDNISEKHRIYKKSETCYHVVFNKSSKLSSLISVLDMNRKALNKYIPTQLLKLPKDLLKQLVDGYMSGDGCYTKKTDVYQATTISAHLAHTLKIAIQKIYGVACLIYKSERPSKYIIDGREVNQHDTYIVRYSTTPKKQKNYYVKDGYILYPVKSVNKTDKNARVYNITVDEDHSYMIPNCFVGNCQDISCAGKQAGIARKCVECGYKVDISSTIDTCPECGAPIDTTRSGLFMDQVRIIKEMREKTNGEYPKIVIWENVGAAFSSNNGDDFYTVLKEFCSLIGEKLPAFRPEKWAYAGEILADTGSIAWRTLDAQYWGVPQRRRRVFLVIDFGGQRASEILFKQESLRRYPTTSEASWKRIAEKTEGCTGATDSGNHTYGLDGYNQTIIPDKSGTLGTNCGTSTGRNGVLCVATQQTNAEIMVDKAPTLTAANGTSGSNRPYIVLDDQGGQNINVYTNDIIPTLRAETHGHVPCILNTEDEEQIQVSYDTTVYGICSFESNSMKSDNPHSGIYEADVVRTLDTSGTNPSCNQGGNVIVSEPVYCLQGNGIDRADTAGCNGKGWTEDVCYTLNTVDRPAVVYEATENIEEHTVGVFLGEQGEKAFGIAYSEKIAPTLKTDEPPTVMCPAPDSTKPYVAAFAHQTGGSIPMMPYNEELSPTLTSKQTMAVVIVDDERDITLIDTHSQDCRWNEAKDNVCPTLTAAMGMGRNNTPFVVETKKSTLVEQNPTDARYNVCEDGVCQTLTARMGTGGGNVPMVVEETVDSFAESGFATYSESTVGTLRASGGTFGGGSENLISKTIDSTYTMTTGSFMSVAENVASTLMSRDYKDAQLVVKPKSIVRRLTPLECERLQGFPDNWTSGESDANRYKALGNSVALPCVDYIMRGVREVLDNN